VWSLKPELPSRLIESLLLQIPIPPIYFYNDTENDNTLEGLNIFNAVYRGNEVFNIGGRTSSNNNTGSGIVFNGVQGGLAEFNKVHDCGGNYFGCGGPVGLWAFRTSGVVFQFNEVYRQQPMNPTGNPCDQGAFDADGGVTNCIWQYNYSHDNYGPAMLFYQEELPHDNNTYRHNIPPRPHGAISKCCCRRPTMSHSARSHSSGADVPGLQLATSQVAPTR
jgi:hypothetical protein